MIPGTNEICKKSYNSLLQETVIPGTHAVVVAQMAHSPVLVTMPLENAANKIKRYVANNFLNVLYHYMSLKVYEL